SHLTSKFKREISSRFSGRQLDCRRRTESTPISLELLRTPSSQSRQDRTPAKQSRPSSISSQGNRSSSSRHGISQPSAHRSTSTRHYLLPGITLIRSRGSQCDGIRLTIFVMRQGFSTQARIDQRASGAPYLVATDWHSRPFRSFHAFRTVSAYQPPALPL